MVKLPRIPRHERRRIRQPTDGPIADRVRMPSDPRARICSLHHGAEKTQTTKAVILATRFNCWIDSQMPFWSRV
jgi:hypothetical protein